MARSGIGPLSLLEAARLLPRVGALFRPYRRHMLLVVLSILVSAVLTIASPLLIRAIFDKAFFCAAGCPNLSLVYELAAALAAAGIAANVISLGQSYLSARIGQSMMGDLRQSLYEHLQTLPLRFFTETRTGEIQSRMTNDVSSINAIVAHGATDMIANFVVVLSSVAAMFVIAWQLTLVSLLLTPTFAVAALLVGDRGRRRWRLMQESQAELTSLTEETLSVSGVLLAKAFGRGPQQIERFRDVNERLTRHQLSSQLNSRAFWAFVGSVFALTPAVIFVVVGYLLSHGITGGYSPGTIVAFMSLQAGLYWPIGHLFGGVIDVHSSLASFQRVFEYLDVPRDLVEHPDARVLSRPEVRGAVHLHDVRFRYAKDGPWTLDRVDMEIAPGQLAALVGPTGAGKTTLSYLLARLYEPAEGRIEIDGLDVRKISAQSLTDIMATVTQETYLFHTTVRENLRYAKSDASDDELEAAARAGHIHDRITQLPQGYDTLVGERGYRLSGGEKQRLAIARAVLKDPRILVLDEATSSLDTISERIVQRALREFVTGRTTIAIAHRLSTIVSADVIFVLDGGRIVERGTHDELVERGGLYSRLYAEQFGGGLIEARCADGVVLAADRGVEAAL